jgi:uncharacterized protein YyaL (SSP411 family)
MRPVAGFFTSHDHERLIRRPKPAYDQATPAGNGVAAVALQRLGHLLGEPRYLAGAERTLQLFYPQLTRQPAGCMSLLGALAEHLSPPTLVILRGPANLTAAWQKDLVAAYLPRSMLIIVLPNELLALPATLAKPPRRKSAPGSARAPHCLPPLTALPQLLELCRARSLP